MDKEALQRQLEDMEEASERWRAERRRLNAEIDKLESALADAKTAAARKKGSAGDDKSQPDPAVIAKLQEEAEERVKRAAEEWETDRTKMTAKITRLEGAVAEAISRASNPLRVTQAVKEQFELELNRVAKEKSDLEQVFLRSKTEWEQEKLKMTGEMVKLRRAAQIMGRPVPMENAPEVHPKVRDLEKQLKERVEQWNSEREGFVAQIQKLEEVSRQWDTERRQLSDHAGQLQQAFTQAQAKIEKYEIGARKPHPAKAQVEELKREIEGMQREVEADRDAWNAERAALEAQRAQIEEQLKQMPAASEEASNAAIDQLRQQYEQRLEEAVQEKTQLAHELEKVQGDLQEARSAWEAERGRLESQSGQVQQQLQQLRQQHDQRLEEVSQEKAQLAKELQEARTSAEAVAQVEPLHRENERIQQEFQAARDMWDAERSRVESQIEQLQQQLQRLSDTHEPVSNDVVDQLRQQYEQRLQEAIQEKTQLAQELQNASALVEAGGARLSSAQKDMGTRLDGNIIEAEISRVEGMLTEILTVIDNPSTELSTVIRKNVEKAELDSYLRGILFALGKK